MAKPTIDQVKAMAREAFGRDIDTAAAEAYRGRLPTMAENIRRLRAFEGRLGVTDPAAVQRMIPAGGTGGEHD